MYTCNVTQCKRSRKCQSQHQWKPLKTWWTCFVKTSKSSWNHAAWSSLRLTPIRYFSKVLHAIWVSWKCSPSQIHCTWCLWYKWCKFQRNFISCKNKAAVDFLLREEVADVSGTKRYRLCSYWKWIGGHVMGWTIQRQPCAQTCHFTNNSQIYFLK